VRSVSECVQRSHCAAGHTPTQTRHRTHLSGETGGRADSIHTATPGTTKQNSHICVVSGVAVSIIAFVHISLICNATHHLPTTTENIVTTLLQKLSVKRQGALLCQSKSCQLLHNCKDHLYNKSTTNQSTGVEQKSIDRWCIVTEFQTLIS